MLPALVTLTVKVWLCPDAHVVGIALVSMVADQVPVAGWVTSAATAAHCWGVEVTWSNQNECSTIINASMTSCPPCEGALKVTVRVTLAFGARSAGSAKAVLLSH